MKELDRPGRFETMRSARRRNISLMPQQTGSLSVSQARALRALSSGGMLTREQIRHAAGLDRLEILRGVSNLSSRGLILVRSYDKRCSITASGSNTLAAYPFAYGGLATGA